MMLRNTPKFYKDTGISSAKGRDKRPRLDGMFTDAGRRKFDVVMLGPSTGSDVH
jgi:hypothetical protein